MCLFFIIYFFVCGFPNKYGFKTLYGLIKLYFIVRSQKNVPKNTKKKAHHNYTHVFFKWFSTTESVSHGFILKLNYNVFSLP